MSYWNQRNIADPEKAQDLASAFFDYMRAQMLLSIHEPVMVRGSVFPEESFESQLEQKQLIENVRLAELNLRERFYLATKRRLYRVDDSFYVDGVLVF